MMRYTPEQHAFMHTYLPEHYHFEAVAEFNRRWPETPITKKQSRQYAKDHHLRSKYRSAVEAGEKLPLELRLGNADTQFKKGRTPHNWCPVGTIRKSTDGYNMKKIAEPKTWRFLSHLVWEDHNGPIPEGYAVFHVNGQKDDDRIENLAILKRSELSRVNCSGLLTNDAEINRCVISVAKLQDKTAKLQKQK